MYESYMNKIEDVGKLRNLKPGTIRTYKNNVRDFLLYLKNKGNKASTLNNKNAALVFFYERVLGKLWDDNLVPRAINDYAVPKVLSRAEIERLLDATPNLKYKAIFAIMYSSGLRISEVLHLKYDDISRTNMQIYIRYFPVLLQIRTQSLSSIPLSVFAVIFISSNSFSSEK